MSKELITSNPAPFRHKELEHVQLNISLARKFKEKGNGLASILICMNIADYLAEFIASGLTMMGIEAVKKYYLGLVQYSPKLPKECTIKESMKVISNYDFADKDRLMDTLGRINSDRNHLAHKIVKSGQKSIPEVDRRIEELFVLTDTLIDITNTLQQSLPPENAVEKFYNK